jgi:DNA-3-methyladenine glycosylase II
MGISSDGAREIASPGARDIRALPAEETAVVALLAEATAHLANADRRFATLVLGRGPCGLRRRPPGFATLLQAIVRQQLSRAAAATISGRLAAACGGDVCADVIAGLPDADFATAGVSRAKRDALRALASAIAANPAWLTDIATLPDEDAIAALRAIKGIGRWTAEMYVMFSLGRLDVLPVGDAAIRAAIADLYGSRRARTSAALLRVAEPWRPYRSVACWYLYAHLDRGPGV